VDEFFFLNDFSLGQNFLLPDAPFDLFFVEYLSFLQVCLDFLQKFYLLSLNFGLGNDLLNTLIVVVHLDLTVLYQINGRLEHDQVEDIICETLLLLILQQYVQFLDKLLQHLVEVRVIQLLVDDGQGFILLTDQLAIKDLIFQVEQVHSVLRVRREHQAVSSRKHLYYAHLFLPLVL